MTTTVLVAESNAELREIYRKFLGWRGFNVRAAACGLECLAKLRQETPAVLVLDRALPWGGGDGVLAWLREEGLQGEVAVVLTSTTGAPRAAAEDTEVPVVTSLAKPFTLAALLQSVRAAANERVGPLIGRDCGRTRSEFSVG